MSRQLANCIDAASREIARAIEPYLVAAPRPPNRLHECIAAVIRRHLERLPVAEPLSVGWSDRDAVGRIVRDAWVERCKLKSMPRPDQLVPFEQLSAFEQETDRCIGDAVVQYMQSRAVEDCRRMRTINEQLSQL